MKKYAANISGSILEFGDPRYKAYFPEARSYDVVSVVPGDAVDVVADIQGEWPLPDKYYDCVVCTQVFEHLEYPERATGNLFRMLKPGGVLLLTVPFIAQIHGDPGDFRRFTPDACRLILEDGGFEIECSELGGNALVALSFLMGLTVEEHSRQDLDRVDPAYPIVVMLRAVKPGV